MSNNPPLSITEVAALPENTWINDGFTAVVREVQEKVAQKTQKKFWVLILADPANGTTAEAACFTHPKVKAGDQIDVTGNGIKRKDDYQGSPKISWGEKATITVVGQNVSHGNQAASASAPAGSGGGDPLPKGDFHTAMKREALVYLHCLQYADVIIGKLHAVLPALADGLRTPEHTRHIATSLAIRAEKLGLASVVPAFGPAPAQPADRSAAPKAQQARGSAGGRPSEEQLANREDAQGRPIHMGDDSDVPF